MPKPRKPSLFVLEKTMKIFCEGQKTEPNYINGYLLDRGADNRQTVIRVEKTNKNTPVQLVEAAIASKNSEEAIDGDIFWVVYDREGASKYPDELHEKARKLAESNGISIALSNVCFDYWILLHFIETDAPYADFTDLKKTSALNDEYKKRTGSSYEKASPDIYNVAKAGITRARTRATRLNSEGRRNAARGRDKQHHINPYMGMVDLLNSIDEFK